MFDEICADLATGGHDVDHTGWPARLEDRLGEQQAVEHSLRTRLHDDRAARRDKWCELEHGEGLWVVPRHDRADDAHRLAQHVDGAAEQALTIFL